MTDAPWTTTASCPSTSLRRALFHLFVVGALAAVVLGILFDQRLPADRPFDAVLECVG